jgi:hypothetical protein
MISGVADPLQVVACAESRSTPTTCPICVMTLPLDDERPRTGTAIWEILPKSRVKIGTAVRFECPNGHSSEDDPELLKAFPSRRF